MLGLSPRTAHSAHSARSLTWTTNLQTPSTTVAVTGESSQRANCANLSQQSTFGLAVLMMTTTSLTKVGRAQHTSFVICEGIHGLMTRGKRGHHGDLQPISVQTAVHCQSSLAHAYHEAHVQTSALLTQAGLDRHPNSCTNSPSLLALSMSIPAGNTLLSC